MRALLSRSRLDSWNGVIDKLVIPVGPRDLPFLQNRPDRP